MTRQERERKRQARDRNRARNAHAFRYILGHWQRTGKVPGLHELSQWIEDAGYKARVSDLIDDMCKKGWLAYHGPGYKLITQTSPESIIPALIEAHEKRDEQLFQEYVLLWERDKGKASGKTRSSKAGRGPLDGAKSNSKSAKRGRKPRGKAS